MKLSFKMLEIGSLSLPSPILYAPLAGCSDFPMRWMNRKFHKGLMFCEMVKMEALIRSDAQTFRLLDFIPEMHPIGAQLCGSDPKIAGKAARIAEDLGFDVIDLNCGCPVDKVTKDHSGSGLLKFPEKIGEILSNIVASVQIPVTVKIRIGWDAENIVASDITRIAEEAGAEAIAVHARTRQQAYRGAADWNEIRKCINAARNIKVIGNGDVFHKEDAMRMLEIGCDGVLVARGALGAPWIGEDAYRYLNGEEVQERNYVEIKELMLEHFQLIAQYQSEKKAILDMRRVGCWYLKTLHGVKEFRQRLNKIQSSEEGIHLIQSFNPMVENTTSLVSY